MKVSSFACGPFANDSERKAFENVRSRLESTHGDDAWVLLTNRAFSVTHRLQSDEIDLIAVGPPGVRVVEVKHWTPQWVDAHRDLVEQEADKVTSKARKIGTTLRRSVPELGRVDGAILLTREPAKVKSLAGRRVRGVGIHTLQEWKEAIGFDVVDPSALRPPQVARLSRLLEPKSVVALDGSLRRFAGYVNLELQSPKEHRFHRVYTGVHSARQDKVILHLYDLSARDDANENKARREFEALRRLQLHDWAPRILDSFQDAPGYDGEMHFFTVVDPAAPSVAQRASDARWATRARLAFARSAVHALRELHGASTDDAPVAHRNLGPRTILVRHDDTPIFTGFEWTKIPSEISVASTGAPVGGWDRETAPEVRAGGRHAATPRSDVYSLCASLTCLFRERDDETSRRAVIVLEDGLADDPAARCGLEDLETALGGLLGETPPPAEPPPARFWTEDQIVPFNGRDYRVVGRLGSGGVGTAFKVVEIDRATKEDLGTYVAKVAHDEETGRRTVGAYSLARSHLQHQAVSGIFEVAREWRENAFTALMTWVDGAPLSDFTGVFPLLAEEQGEQSGEALAIRWLRTMCEALDVLHRNGLVHGDVNPRNVIVSGGDLVLTDYDFVRKVGVSDGAPGAALYCAPSSVAGRPATPADDFYALAASFFHVLLEKEPFRYGADLVKQRGLNWEGIARAEHPVVADFFDRAAHPDPGRRFRSAQEALEALPPPKLAAAGDAPTAAPSGGPGTPFAPDAGVVPAATGEQREAFEQVAREDAGAAHGAAVERREQSVPWLRSLLQSYPGSRYGNRETRGLDSDFAERTYVETPLEEVLHHDVRGRRVRLVVLCGNAGDGKTALLQHLAERFGVVRRGSSERILEGRTEDGLIVRMNLDGSASWQGKSADDLLDEFLKPFQHGPPAEDVAHLLAINDGRLLEWIEGVEQRLGGEETPLTFALSEHLGRANGSAPEVEADADAAVDDSHVRFVNLNDRSLVGGVTPGGTGIETGFLERLLDSLYGGEAAAETWAPCRTCSAQERCEVFRANRLFGPDALAGGTDPEVRARARERLFHTLQAVHLRGEMHVTVRELRAALVYILFGVDFCDDYHRGGTDRGDRSSAAPASGRASAAASPFRQGDLFGDLVSVRDEAVPEAGVEAWPYWNRAFAPASPARQGELLRELVHFDPALDAHPRLDRRLLRDRFADDDSGHPESSLASARRRAYFEWTSSRIRIVACDEQQEQVLALARGRHLRRFRDIPVDRAAHGELCRDLCAGISRLEGLPPEALDRSGAVPLRIPPRTPTETRFWIEKRLADFRLEADLPPEAQGFDRLHRQAFLIYRYRDGKEERLRLGAELFHLLLELGEGYQLGDVSTDDTFAHLSIFVQRLVREDDRKVFALSPMSESVHVIAVVDMDERQRMVIQPRPPEASDER